MTVPTAQTKEVISFGPFRLTVNQRLLERNGAPVELGARALDILVTLASRPNEIVSKKDLLARVWPNISVEDSSVRAHIANLRRVLSDGAEGSRYITTISGRGYCFVVPVSRSSGQRDRSPEATRHLRYGNLPGQLIRMVGRGDDVQRLSAQLVATRFVSVVGTGGIGKTTVAVAVGRRLSETFADAVLFVDLGALSDPGLVTASIASILGLSVQSADATPILIAHLRDKRVLLILDTCEHLIDAVAQLASRIVAAAPQVHILATSREPLQVEGEHVYKLDPLACPPDDPGLTAPVAETFPAVQLFVDRAAASGARIDFGDAEACIVAGICRKLDGVALAIELAARRVEAYGLAQTAEILDQRLMMLKLALRTAPARQKTLQATLDWSYGLLSEPERVVLRRLAVLVGHFTLDAALAVATSTDINQSMVFGAIDNLVTKSMVATDPIGGMMRYRLLDTTRAYTLAIRLQDAEQAELGMRHVTYYRRWLEQNVTDWPTLSSNAERAPHLVALNNVRAALEWCFGENGNVEAGVGLAAAAAPAFLALSLLTECHRWSERAIGALGDAMRGSPEEMQLQAALGACFTFVRGEMVSARAALNRSLAIAEERASALDQVRLLVQLEMLGIRSGDYKTARYYGMRCSVIAETIVDPGAVAAAHFLLGSVYHFMGDLHEARTELEAALQRAPTIRLTSTIYLGYELRNSAGAILARNLWLQGHPALAMERARQTIEDAAAMDHSLTLCVALILCISLFFWSDDLESAERHIDWLISRSETYSLAPYLAAGRGFKQVLAVRRGNTADGIESLRHYLNDPNHPPYPLFSMVLVQGLAAIGRSAEAVTLIDETIRQFDTGGDLHLTPELFRVKGSVMLKMPNPDRAGAEACFAQSLALSRHQGARAWELRTATDLATFWAEQGRTDEAKALLQPLLEHFGEEFDTPDLKAAELLLARVS